LEFLTSIPALVGVGPGTLGLSALTSQSDFEKAIMGEFTLPPLLKVVGWTATIVMGNAVIGDNGHLRIRCVRADFRIGQPHGIGAGATCGA